MHYQALGERGTKEEAPRIQPHNDIGLLAKLEHLELESAQQSQVDGHVLEEGQDVDELDAGNREVREVAERTEQSYLCTGEFGGTGGGGGGLSSRGIVGGGVGHGVDGDRRVLVVAGLHQRLGSVDWSAHVGKKKEGRRGGWKEGKRNLVLY